MILWWNVFHLWFPISCHVELFHSISINSLTKLALSMFSKSQSDTHCLPFTHRDRNYSDWTDQKAGTLSYYLVLTCYWKTRLFYDCFLGQLTTEERAETQAFLCCKNFSAITLIFCRFLITMWQACHGIFGALAFIYCIWLIFKCHHKHHC